MVRTPLNLFPEKAQCIKGFALVTCCYETILGDTKIKTTIDLTGKELSMFKVENKSKMKKVWGSNRAIFSQQSIAPFLT